MDTNRGKQKVSYEDKLDAQAVRMFRYDLVRRNLLPASQDNYHTMLRFLKDTRSFRNKLCSYEYDDVSATCKWEEMINWRRRYRLDTIIQDFVYKEHDDVQLFYPHGFHGVDKAGRPIYIEFANRINTAKLMEVTTEDRIMKSYYQECEKMVVEKFPACSEIANMPIDSVVYILVLPEGITNWNKGFKPLKYEYLIGANFRKILADYYPQTVHQFFYINAGIIMKLLMRIDNLDRDRRKKPIGIYTLGQDFRTKLLEFIDEDQLPTLLGGSCSCPGKEGGCLRFEKGPWEFPQAKDKKAEKALNKRKEIPETMQIIPSWPPVTIQPRNAKLPSDSGSALSPETACHKCTQLEYNVNLLSSKLDKLQTTLDLVLSAQDRANCCGASRKLKKL